MSNITWNDGPEPGDEDFEGDEFDKFFEELTRDMERIPRKPNSEYGDNTDISPTEYSG